MFSIYADRKKKIKINENTFNYCDNCIKIKGMKKGSIAVLDEMDVHITDNSFENVRNTALCLENLSPGRMVISHNRVSKCNSIGFKLFFCKASKEDIIMRKNTFNGVYQIAICIESSMVNIDQGEISSCNSGIYLYLLAQTTNRDEVFDSHNLMILKDTIRDSFIAGGNSYNQSILENKEIAVSQQQQGQQSSLNPICYRVMIRGLVVKEVNQYGVMIQNTSGSLIRIEECTYRNVRDPIVVNEKDLMMSRIGTKNLLMENMSEMLAGSAIGIGANTPRQQFNQGKGTIIIKRNKFEESEASIVKKNISSYFYDLHNVLVPSTSSK